MDVRISRHRLTVPTVGAWIATGVTFTTFVYRNGYSLLAACGVGAATTLVGLWAVAAED
jgi:hypothetical protein